MFRRLMIAGAAVALLGSSAVAYAQMQNAAESTDMSEMRLNQEKCDRLSKQFDAEDIETGSVNAEATALRRQGEAHCREASAEKSASGVRELVEALKMVGISPVVD